MEGRRHVLITRPADDALPVADMAAERGFVPVIAPMLEIVPVPFDMPETYQGLVFTSANAVRIVAGRTADRRSRVFCVGGRTAETAKLRGWTDVISADGDVAALNRLLAGQRFDPAPPLYHLAGADVAQAVAVPGIDVPRLVIYRAEPAARFSAECFDLLMRHEFAAVLFFSERSAASFAALVRKYGCAEALVATNALCLADSVLNSIRHLPWRDVQVAPRPDRDAVIALLGDGRRQ